MISIQQAFEPFGLSAVNPGAFNSDTGWSATREDKVFSAINPATEEVIAKISVVDEQDYAAVVNCACDAALRWRDFPAPRRGEMILRIGQLVAQHMDALAQIVTLDTGKSLAESKGELKEVVDMATLAAGQSRMMYGYTQQSQRAEHRMYDQWLPLGVVGVISAYNFPAAVWAQNGFLSAIGGNTVIWKPSPKVPLTALAMQKLANQAMEEFNQPGVFSLFMPQDDALAGKMLDDTRIAMISFTGSSRVGKQVAQLVGQSPGRRYMLECSGNNACIVDETADLAQAAVALAFGAVGTTGQRCTSTRRVIVHHTVKQRLTALLCQVWSQINVGDPADSENLVGPLVDKAAVADFEAAVASAQALGGRVVFGGQRMPGKGYFVQPTIIIDASNDWPCVQKETFAPILYIIEYQTLEHAIALNNQVSQGLASGLHSTNLYNIERFLSASGSDCGIVRINMGTTGADVGAAFGGEKETGGGRTAGSDAWKGYMRRQSVCINYGKGSAWGDKFYVDE